MLKMLVFHFFLGISTLFTVAAVPLPSHYLTTVNLNTRHILHRRAPLNIQIKHRVIPVAEHDATKLAISEHHRHPDTSNEQKAAPYAHVKEGWHDGQALSQPNLQCLKFTYHNEESPKSSVVGNEVVITRPKPPFKPPTPRFSNRIITSHKLEMRPEIDKKFAALPPDFSKHVKHIDVEEGWHTSPGAGFTAGIRENTDIFYHTSHTATGANMIGKQTIYRPLTLLMGNGVDKKEAPVIEKYVRKDHSNIPNDARANTPVKAANYGVVLTGWKDVETKSGSVQKQVNVHYLEVTKEIKPLNHYANFGPHTVAFRDCSVANFHFHF